jgi:hypothetical protein
MKWQTVKKLCNAEAGRKKCLIENSLLQYFLFV